MSGKDNENNKINTNSGAGETSNQVNLNKPKITFNTGKISLNLSKTPQSGKQKSDEPISQKQSGSNFPGGAISSIKNLNTKPIQIQTKPNTQAHETQAVTAKESIEQQPNKKPGIADIAADFARARHSESLVREVRNMNVPQKPRIIAQPETKTPKEEQDKTTTQPVENKNTATTNAFKAPSPVKNSPPKKQKKGDKKGSFYDDENTKQAALNKKLLDAKNARKIEKYGISSVKDDNEEVNLLEDLDVNSEFHITEQDVEQDEEKFFGKALSFKSQEYEYFSTNSPSKRKNYGKHNKQHDEVTRDVEISGPITVRDLAALMSEKVGDVIKVLMRMGVNANINDSLDPETAAIIVTEMGHNVEHVEKRTIRESVAEELKSASPSVPRTPVVTIMGHVDHGKTSLLDYIRNTNVTAKEHGGITQHVGAYTIEKSGKQITFLDTPGHAAFSQMRSRGAKVTDIAILVVAADDGIQPQTIEAISHIKSAGVAMIVAINKIDKPDAKPDTIRQNLLVHDVLLEEFGGHIASVEVSAKTGQGIDNLLDAISLQAEIMELKYDPNARGIGYVIESKFDKNRGSIVTIILQHGKLRPGDTLVSGTAYAKIKSMVDCHANRITELKPGIAVEVFGFESSPTAGDTVILMKNEQEARNSIAEEKELQKQGDVIAKRTSNPFQDSENSRKDINIIIKADTFGSLEAVAGMLEKIQHEELNIKICHKGVGNINESDAILAQTMNASIFGFGVMLDQRVRQAMEKGAVSVRLHNIIYNLIDDVKVLLSSNLQPTREEKYIGKASVLQVFGSTRNDCIAGCMVNDGKVLRGCLAKVIRNGAEILKTSVKTVKRFKDDVKEVKAGYECGIQLHEGFLFSKGDTIELFEESFTTRSIEI